MCPELFVIMEEAGTSIRCACSAWGTPTLVPVSVPFVIVVAGGAGWGGGGSRGAAGGRGAPGGQGGGGGITGGGPPAALGEQAGQVEHAERGCVEQAGAGQGFPGVGFPEYFRSQGGHGLGALGQREVHHRGRPRTRSPTWLSRIWVVPPAMDRHRVSRNSPLASPSTAPAGPSSSRTVSATAWRCPVPISLRIAGWAP